MTTVRRVVPGFINPLRPEQAIETAPGHTNPIVAASLKQVAGQSAYCPPKFEKCPYEKEPVGPKYDKDVSSRQRDT